MYIEKKILYQTNKYNNMQYIKNINIMYSLIISVGNNGKRLRYSFINDIRSMQYDVVEKLLLSYKIIKLNILYEYLTMSLNICCLSCNKKALH